MCNSHEYTMYLLLLALLDKRDTGYFRRTRFSLECRKVIGFALLHHMIGVKNSHHFFIQSERHSAIK